MTSRAFLGICDQTTEYLDEFQRHVIPPDSKKVISHDKTFFKNTTTKNPKFSTSYDTLQKLDYANRPPFDALWPVEPKAVALNQRVPPCIPTSRKEQPRLPPRKKEFALANPAADVDQVDDSELRKILLAYTYKTWKKRDDAEVWENWMKTDGQSSTAICNDSVNSVTPEFKLFPDLPAGFKAAAKVWDSLQDRTVIEDEKPQQRAGGPKKLNEPVRDCKKIIESMNEKKYRPDDEKLELLDDEISLVDDDDSDTEDEPDEKTPEKPETRLSK